MLAQFLAAGDAPIAHSVDRPDGGGLRLGGQKQTPTDNISITSVARVNVILAADGVCRCLPVVGPAREPDATRLVRDG